MIEHEKFKADNFVRLREFNKKLKEIVNQTGLDSIFNTHDSIIADKLYTYLKSIEFKDSLNDR